MPDRGVLHRLTWPAIAALALLGPAFETPAKAEVVIDVVRVGNPGNAASGSGYGSVGYVYDIGQYEVTINQYVEFLSAVAQFDFYGLYDTAMGTDANVYGISRVGIQGSYGYSAFGPAGSTPSGADSGGNRPITYLSWFNAARFANWLANGQPQTFSGQTDATTEDGAYTLQGATSGTAPPKNAINPNTGAVPTWWIPTTDEWYKAAYYDPNIGGGVGGYWTYAMQTDSDPGNQILGGAPQANYAFNGNYSVTGQPAPAEPGQNYLTNVGAYSTSPSYYGTFDQNGNVLEWSYLATAADGNQMQGGGSWDQQSAASLTALGEVSTTVATGFRNGLRVATVPEPAVVGGTGLMVAALTCRAWRRRR